MQRLSLHRLTRAREASGLTREQAAMAVDRSYHSIVSYETGRVSPPVAVLARLADVYDVKVADLFHDTEATDQAPVAS